ncbi:aldo/keto reductase, partial [Nodularia sphaerocarpa]
PLALGILTGKYAEKGSLPKGIRGLLFRQLLPGVRSLLECLREVAQSRNKTMSQVAINWCICKGTIPIPGAKSLEQAQQNIGALGWLLDSGEIAALDQAAASTDKKMVQNIFQTQ